MEVLVYVARERRSFVDGARATPHDIHLALAKHIECLYDVLELRARVGVRDAERCLSSEEVEKLVRYGELCIKGRDRVEELATCLGIEGGMYVVLRLVRGFGD